jgi:hypothetical protein
MVEGSTTYEMLYYKKKTSEVMYVQRNNEALLRIIVAVEKQ